jgi:hypothetical protein
MACCAFLPPLYNLDELWKSKIRSIHSVNAALENIGVQLAISESEWRNDELVFMMLPVDKQTVYWLSATSYPGIDELFKTKYRMDILMGDQEELMVEGRKIISRNAQYVVVIEPEGIVFDKYQLKIEELV